MDAGKGFLRHQSAGGEAPRDCCQGGGGACGGGATLHEGCQLVVTQAFIKFRTKEWYRELQSQECVGEP